MHLSYIGLGKMGKGMVARLLEKGHQVSVFDEHAENCAEMEALGAQAASSIEELISHLSSEEGGQKIVWLMVPQASVEDVLQSVLSHTTEGDIVIDGGNSHFKESKRRAALCKEKGVQFLDVGVSGGPKGARSGACLMVGGEQAVFEKLLPLFQDLCVPEGCLYAGKSGAGHFVKMVHNAIEYGFMQSLAEGFELLAKSEFKPSLSAVAHVFNNGSVIESKLVALLKEAYQTDGEELAAVSGSTQSSGEGDWAYEAAKELKVEMPALGAALEIRKKSLQNPSYQGKILTSLRHQFGGHSKEI